MNLSKVQVLGIGLVIWGGSALISASERVPTPAPLHNKKLAGLMQSKLAHSQKIVEGLVSEDFDLIRAGASELNRICDATEWVAHKDQVYSHYRTELKRQAQKLVKMADDQNLDGVSFGYMHTLNTCVNCHQHCRDVLKIARAD